MRIDRFATRVIEIPMRFSVKHALTERKLARNVLVSAHGGGLTGWGESCPRAYVTGETVESVLRTLDAKILPRLEGLECESFAAVARALTGVLDGLARDEQAAFCAAELAVLDLAGKALGVSAGAVLGPVLHNEARYSGVVATTDPDGVRKLCGFMREFGVEAVKVKVDEDLDRNLALLKVARKILGDGVSLRVDANCAWSGDESLRQLEAMAPFRIEAIEQPVAADDLAGLKQVTQAGLVPVEVDESLCSLADAELLIREQACDIFNIRVSKCGGLINCGRLHRMAQAAGLGCKLGAQVGETGLLSAAGRHYATRMHGVVWCEGSYGRMLLEEEITEPDITVGPGGRAPALDTPGLGVTPVPERLEARTCR